MAKMMTVIKDGNKVQMTYDDICHDLGFIPEIKFVRVTNHGTICWTIGKPGEIQALRAAVKSHGYVMSKKLRTCVL